MSWTSRLKKTVGGGAPAPAPSPEPAELDLPPVETVDPASVDAGAIIDLLADDLVLISENKLARDEIEADGHIFDYGYVDSLSAVIFLARIEERFGVQIEDIELIESSTDLNSLAERIKQGH